MALLGWSGPVAAAAQRAARAPFDLDAKNVLMIVIDDVGSDKMSLFDDVWAPPYPLTPRMDALAAQGIRFTSFYTHTICSVTRASLQTGRYPLRTGMGSNTEVWELPDSEVLLAELLKKGLPAGKRYHSGSFGKWHLGQSDPGHAVDNGYDRFYGTLGNTNDHYVWSKYEHDAGSPPSAPLPQSTWSASDVRADALRWINAQYGPFFAWVSFNPPHISWQVPPKALLSDATVLELTGYTEGQVASNDTQRKLFYRAMLEAVDTEIGALLDGMDPLKRQNTVVFIVSDNGAPDKVIEPPHDPTHSKPTAYQLAIRVPMIVAGAMVPAAPPGGFVCDALVEAVDFWPTIAAITGANTDLAFQNSGFMAPYPTIDGQSFLPLILDPSGIGAKSWVFSQLYSPAGFYVSSQCLRVHLRAITDGEYKFIRLVQKDVGVPLCSPFTYADEFYHVAVDNGETNNLLSGTLTPAQQLVLDYLTQQMDVLSEY